MSAKMGNHAFVKSAGCGSIVEDKQRDAVKTAQKQHCIDNKITELTHGSPQQWLEHLQKSP